MVTMNISSWFRWRDVWKGQSVCRHVMRAIVAVPCSSICLMVVYSDSVGLIACNLHWDSWFLTPDSNCANSSLLVDSPHWLHWVNGIWYILGGLTWNCAWKPSMSEGIVPKLLSWMLPGTGCRRAGSGFILCALMLPRTPSQQIQGISFPMSKSSCRNFTSSPLQLNLWLAQRCFYCRIDRLFTQCQN